MSEAVPLTFLVRGEVLPVGGDQTLRVDGPDLSASLVLGHALEHEEAGQLHGNTNASAASTEEEDAVLVEGSTGGLAGEPSGIDESTARSPG